MGDLQEERRSRDPAAASARAQSITTGRSTVRLIISSGLLARILIRTKNELVEHLP
jgi:hypothetical protein